MTITYNELETTNEFVQYDFTPEIVALEEAYSDYMLFAFDGLYDDDDWDSDPWFGATEGLGDDMKNANGFAAKFRTIINAIVAKLKNLAATFRDVIQKSKHGDGRIWSSEDSRKVLEVTRKSVQDFVNASPEDRNIVNTAAKGVERYFKEYASLINELNSKLDNAISIANSSKSILDKIQNSDGDDSSEEDKVEMIESIGEEIDELIDKIGDIKLIDSDIVLKGSPKAAKEVEKLALFTVDTVNKTFATTFSKKMEPIPGVIETCRQFLEKALQDVNNAPAPSNNNNDNKDGDNNSNNSDNDKAAKQYNKSKKGIGVANKLRSGVTKLGSLLAGGAKKAVKAVSEGGSAIHDKAAEFKENMEESKGENMYYDKYKGKSTKELQQIIDEAKSEIDKYKDKDDDDSKQRTSEARARLNGATKVMAKGKANDEKDEGKKDSKVKDNKKDEEESPGLKVGKPDKHGKVDSNEKPTDEDNGKKDSDNKDDDKYGMSDDEFTKKIGDEMSTVRKLLSEKPEKAAAYMKEANKKLVDAERALDKAKDNNNIKEQQRLNFEIELQKRIVDECKDGNKSVSEKVLNAGTAAEVLGLSEDAYKKMLETEGNKMFGKIPKGKKERVELINKVKKVQRSAEEEVEKFKEKIKEEPDKANWVKEYKGALKRFAVARSFAVRITNLGPGEP